MESLALEEQGKRRRQALDRAKVEGHWDVVDRLLGEEWDDVAGSFLTSQMEGLDPLTNLSPRARHASPETYQPFVLERELLKQQQHDAVFEGHQGIQDSLKGLKTFADQWREVNKAPLAAISPFASHGEQMLGSSKLVQQEIPEAISQEWIDQTWDYINQQKQVDTDYDPAKDPRIRKMVNTLNSMGRRQAGGAFFTGAPEEAEDLSNPVTQFLRQVSMSAADVVGTAGEKIGEGIFTLGLAVLEGTDSEFYKAYQREITPQYYIDTETGKIAHTKGRVGGLAGPYVNLKLMMGMNVEDIRKEVDRVKAAHIWNDTRKRTKLNHYSDILARTLGGLVGMGATGGFRAIQFGNKGAAMLLRAAPGTKVGVLAQLLGTGVGYGAWNMGMYGDVEGYGHAFLDAMQEAPIFVVAGTLGARLEKALAQKRMPRAAKRGLAGMLEGTVFTAAEMGGIESSLWNFMRNPEDKVAQRDWVESIVGNVLGFGIFKALTGMSPGRYAAVGEAIGPEGMQVLAQRFKTRQARRSAAMKVDPKDITTMASIEGVKPETFRKYSETLKQQEMTTDAKLRARLEDKIDEIERELEREAQEVDRTRLEEVEEELPTVEEISRAREMPSGPEKTQRILELQRQARGRFAGKAAEALRIEEEGRIVREPAPVTEARRGVPEGIEAMAVDPKAMRLVERAQAGKKLTQKEIETVARELAKQLPKGEVPDLAKEKPLTPEQLADILTHPDVEAMVTAPGQFGPGVPKSLQLEPGMEPVPGAKDVRLSQIQERLEGTKADPVFTKMRGGVPNKAARAGILGWFARFSQTVRVPVVAGKKLAIMLHEWSHAMEKQATKQGFWEDTRVPGWMMSEFAKVAETYPNYNKLKHRSKVAEGWAEFWAREMFGDPTLKTEVPDLYDYMMDWIAKPEHYKFKRQHDEAMDMVSDWTGIGALRRGRMELGLGGRQPTIRERLGKGAQRAWTEFNRTMTDDVAAWKAVEKAYLKHAGVVPEHLPITLRPTDLVDAFRMTQGSIADQFIKTGSRNLAGKKTGEGIEEILSELVPKDQRADFMVYMNAKWGLDAIREGLETPANKAEYLYRIQQLQRPEFDQATDRVRKWAGRLLDYMQEGGAITEVEKNYMQTVNPYGFMFREMSRSAREKDPMEVIRGVTESAISRTQQAMVARGLWLQSHLLEGAGPIVTGLEVGKPPRIAEHLAKLTAGDPNAFYSFFLSPSTAEGKAPTLTFRPKFTEQQLKDYGLQGDALKKAMEQSSWRSTRRSSRS
jgi:hypothetical protein